MQWLGAYRPRTASLDKGLVMAAWWTVTRSMVCHCIGLGSILIALTFWDSALAYTAVLHSPLWLWGGLLIVFAVTWLFSRGLLCVLAGVAVAVWFFTISIAFLLAWLALSATGTALTAWATYLFLGWAWLLVTYVVFRDEQHVKAEVARMTSLQAEIEELEEKRDS